SAKDATGAATSSLGTEPRPKMQPRPTLDGTWAVTVIPPGCMGKVKSFTISILVEGTKITSASPAAVAVGTTTAGHVSSKGDFQFSMTPARTFAAVKCQGRMIEETGTGAGTFRQGSCAGPITLNRR